MKNVVWRMENEKEPDRKKLMRITIILLSILCAVVSGSRLFSQQPGSLPSKTRSKLAKYEIDPILGDPRERHLANIKQLTNEGENAEAYFSPDGKKLIFQRAAKGDGCDQIFSMNIDGSDMKMLSNGQGKTTCSYFTPDNKHIIYASTFKASPDCPPKPDYSRGYVWSLFPGFDILIADLDGSNVRPLTTTARYDAEATIRKDGAIVFTSLRDGDLDIYTMDKDGKNVKRLTDELGYDGGPFWSYDGKQIVYRAYHPETEKEKADYLALLKEDLIRPTKLDIWVMNADGSNKRRVTKLDKASFAPYFFPDGKRIIFSSNRNGAKQGDTNVFIADWVE